MIRLFCFILPKMREVDVIHVHGINMALVGFCFAKLFKKRVVFQSHALYSFAPGSLFAKVTAFLLRRMDAVLTLCQASKDEFVRLGVPAEQIKVYHHWIDLERFNLANNVRQHIKGITSAPFTACFVGRLIRIKGEEVVIELARRFPEVQFKIAGGGPNQQRVNDAAKMLANLEYVGAIPNSQIHVYYQTADVVLVPSQYPEGFGRVICEALACGTPVIASNIGGIPDAMDNTVGVLCDLDVNFFAKALEHMVSDREWYQSLRRNCRPYAERQFSAENAEVIFKAYQ
jgi:glycosyltransferase involved in cell wall biosynthesis